VLWKLISELHSETARPVPTDVDGVCDRRSGGRSIRVLYQGAPHVVDGVAGLRIITDGLITDPESRSMRPIYAVGPKQPAQPAANSPGLIRNPLSLVRSALNGVTFGPGFVRQLA